MKEDVEWAKTREAIRARDRSRPRERMGDTADALAYKADVNSTDQGGGERQGASVKEKVTGVGGRVSDATPDAGEVKQQARSAPSASPRRTRSGWPSARSRSASWPACSSVDALEDEKIGPMADQVKDQVKETAQVAVEHGKQVAQDAAQAATETAKDAARSTRARSRTRPSRPSRTRASRSALPEAPACRGRGALHGRRASARLGRQPQAPAGGPRDRRGRGRAARDPHRGGVDPAVERDGAARPARSRR